MNSQKIIKVKGDIMNIYEKLNKIQTELKAPKNQFNKFGNYNYRSLEDITEGVKSLLKETGTVLLLNDEVVYIEGRFYVKATATLTDAEGSISNTAYAREEENKKGMDASQLTGSTSSYARKYALNGLFAIDDTKDSDATNTHVKEKISTITEVELKTLQATIKATNTDLAKFEKYFKVKELKELTKEQYAKALKMLQKKAQEEEVKQVKNLVGDDVEVR